jgi:hypothetical protein
MSKTEVSDKIRVHQIIDDNIVRAIGDFHSDDFDQDTFVHEINKKFKLTPKESGVDGVKLLEKIIKLSTVKTRGRFNSKELNQNKLTKELFENFQLESL